MTNMRNVAILGVKHSFHLCQSITDTTNPQASGNFGTPITAALISANFNITIITRTTSTTTHPASIPIIRTNYTLDALTTAFTNQDAVICVVGPGGISLQKTFIDAAVAAGVFRFIIDDFGWGLTTKGFKEFSAIHASRREGWDYAAKKAEEVPSFTWTGLSTGNPIDWVSTTYLLIE
jgi:hypothetical protein